MTVNKFFVAFSPCGSAFVGTVTWCVRAKVKRDETTSNPLEIPYLALLVFLDEDLLDDDLLDSLAASSSSFSICPAAVCSDTG